MSPRSARATPQHPDRDAGQEPQPSDQARAPSLSDRDRAILEFERQWWRHAGAKEEAVRAQFGLSTARYYQVLNTLIDSPEAVRHDPMLVRRLQRARDARTRARASRVFAVPDQGADERRPTAVEPE